MSKKYVTKDSGKREQYPNGMRRDTQDGKPRFDLMIPKEVPYNDQLLTRFANLLARGAQKYGERNWESGFSPEALDRARASAFRHFMQWLMGETDEDHAAAVLFNIMQVEYLCYMAPWQEAERVLRQTRFGELHGPKMATVKGQVQNQHPIQEKDKKSPRERIAELKARREERRKNKQQSETKPDLDLAKASTPAPSKPPLLSYSDLVALPVKSVVSVTDGRRLFIKEQGDWWHEVGGGSIYTSAGLTTRYPSAVRKLNASN